MPVLLIASAGGTQAWCHGGSFQVTANLIVNARRFCCRKQNFQSWSGEGPAPQALGWATRPSRSNFMQMRPRSFSCFQL